MKMCADSDSILDPTKTNEFLRQRLTTRPPGQQSTMTLKLYPACAHSYWFEFVQACFKFISFEDFETLWIV
jgi:hypothetical protein